MGAKKKNLTIEDAVTHFLQWITDHRSINTHRMYEGRLKPFRQAFGMRRVKKIKSKQIDQYFARVNKWDDGSPKAPDTIRANITAVEQLQKHITKRMELPCVLVRDSEKPIGRIRERVPTPEESAKIKAVASPAFILVYEALRRSGARPNEMAKAMISDWRQAEFVITLKDHKTARKTGRPRRIVVGEKLEAIIRKSIGDRTEGPIFRTPQGHQWVTDTLSQSFGRYRKAAGVDKELKLYCERHGFATACYHEEFNANDISFLMGHAGDMTQRYIHPDLAKLRAKQDALSL
jgi:site-specific recombinase XerD